MPDLARLGRSRFRHPRHRKAAIDKTARNIFEPKHLKLLCLRRTCAFFLVNISLVLELWENLHVPELPLYHLSVANMRTATS